MTRTSGAFDKSIYDGSTISLKIGEQTVKHRWVYIVGDKICSFLTDDDLYKYVSNMGSNIILYSLAVGNEEIFS